MISAKQVHPVNFPDADDFKQIYRDEGFFRRQSLSAGGSKPIVDLLKINKHA